MLNLLYSFSKFIAIFSETTFGFIPILEVDGKPIAESWAIYRYVAKIAGLMAKDPVEEAINDQNVELFRTWLDKIFPYIRVKFGVDPGNAVSNFSIWKFSQIKKNFWWF